MARYFLDILVDGQMATDDLGQHFATAEDAIAEAHRTLAGLRAHAKHNQLRLRVRVRTQQGVLYVIDEAAND